MTEHDSMRGWGPQAISWVFSRSGARPSFFLGTVLLISAGLLMCGAQAQVPAVGSWTAANSAKPPQEAINASAMTASQTVDQAIPLPQIADRAEDLHRLLQEIRTQLSPKAELVAAERKAEVDASKIRQRAGETRDLLEGTPTPLELADEQRYWGSRISEYSSQRKALTARAAYLQGQIQILEAQQPQWQATWEEVHNSPGIEAVATRIRQELDGIRAIYSEAQEQLNLVVSLQNHISQQDQEISDILVWIRQARERERRRLLERDSRPLWEVHRLHQLESAARPTFRESFDRSFTSAVEFLDVHRAATLGLVATYILALVGIYKLRRYVTRASPSEVPHEASHVLRAPFSAALLVALLGMGEYLASAPMGIAFVVYLLFVIPVIRILAALTGPKLRSVLCLLSLFYALEGLHLLVELPAVLRRELFALTILTALASFGWLARPSQVFSTSQDRSRRKLMIVIRAGLTMLAFSLVANIIGFVSLGQVLGLTALVGGFLAAALYCGARVLVLLLTAILHTQWARDLLDVRANTIERWGSHILYGGATLLWLRSILKLFTVYDSLMNIASDLLRYRIGFDRIHFTIGDALGLVLILLGGYAAANALTFLLKNVVLPKLPLQRGVPYAVSTITYYLLLLLVALAALSAAGVELNKFTVLTGALGVGLGFGLQNIVSNFVSGLILLFERPIHVGDTVEVGGLVGVVRRIGARSSTVVTYQGAEVIVPNSNLLSNQVINWTLSSQWRRVDVPVRVAYGTDPEQVIKLLVGVAESYPGVLHERPPAAFFMGFGESALNFELRFWADRQDIWFQLQSDVAVAVAKALRTAGVEIPFPQRDLHVRTVSPGAGEILADYSARKARFADAAERLGSLGQLKLP